MLSRWIGEQLCKGSSVHQIVGIKRGIDIVHKIQGNTPKPEHVEAGGLSKCASYQVLRVSYCWMLVVSVAWARPISVKHCLWCCMAVRTKR